MSSPPIGKGVLVIERRRQPRLRVELPLDYSRTAEEENGGGSIANVNQGGLLAYLPERLEIGDLFRVKIFAQGESGMNTIQALARVVWKDLDREGRSGQYPYGLELQSFYKDDLTKFRTLLAEIEDSPDE